MTFTPVDFSTWPRSQMFYYFSKMAPTSYSLTVNVDITDIYVALKKAGRKFFPTYLWLVTKCLNRQQEFKTAYLEDRIGYYDTLTPMYAEFHSDDKTFSFIWTEFDDDYEVFYGRYMENKEKFGENHGVLATPQTPPANAYTVSCIPWISFEHFAVHSHEDKPYFFPSVEAGRFFEDSGGRRLMPISITCHHAATDGYHVSRFFEDLNGEMKTLARHLISDMV